MRKKCYENYWKNGSRKNHWNHAPKVSENHSVNRLLHKENWASLRSSSAKARLENWEVWFGVMKVVKNSWKVFENKKNKTTISGGKKKKKYVSSDQHIWKISSEKRGLFSAEQ